MCHVSPNETKFSQPISGKKNERSYNKKIIKKSLNGRIKIKAVKLFKIEYFKTINLQSTITQVNNLRFDIDQQG